MVYGLDSRCLPFCTRIDILPCYDSSAQLCCVWLRVEYKIGEDKHSIITARHQWVIGAYLELLDRVRMYRPGKDAYLNDRPALSNIRQYGYVICGRRVEIWEMTVDIPNGSSRQQDVNETMCEGDCFWFPFKLLVTFNLTIDEGVLNFSEWHKAIMTWGLNQYARDYVETVQALNSAGVKPKEWLLDHTAAIGKELSSIVRDVFNDTGNYYLYTLFLDNISFI